METIHHTIDSCRRLNALLEQKKYGDVSLFFDDHGRRTGLSFACEPTPFFGDRLTDATSLANVDIAIVDNAGKKALIICEIEDEGRDIKRIIGDIYNILLAKRIMIRGTPYEMYNYHILIGVPLGKKNDMGGRIPELKGAIAGIILPSLRNSATIEIITERDVTGLMDKIEKRIIEILQKAQ